jgi:hypothetical protein
MRPPEASSGASAYSQSEMPSMQFIRIPVAVALMALAVGGCGALPSTEPRISGPVAAGAIERALGFRVEQVPEGMAATVPNLQQTYAGRDRRESVLVLVMNGAAARRQVTGGLSHGAGASVIAWRNVIVLYKRFGEGSDRSRRIASVLRAAGS